MLNRGYLLSNNPLMLVQSLELTKDNCPDIKLHSLVQNHRLNI